MPMMRCIRVTSFVAIVCASGIVHADSWVPPSVQVVASESGERLVRVEPGRRGQEGARALVYRYDADAERYAQSMAFTLLHTVAPVDLLLADDGTLVTLDEWAQVGKGEVLVVHDVDGKVAHRYTLEQLLGAKAVAAPSTVSSTWWRCGKPALIAGGHVLHVITYDNGELRLDLKTGQVRHEPGTGQCQ